MNIGCISKKVFIFNFCWSITSQPRNGGNDGCGTLISGGRLLRRHLTSVCAQPVARYEVGSGVEGNETISSDQGY